MTDYGTCPVCGREQIHLNRMTGMLAQHLRRRESPPPRHETCPGSNTPPAESRASKP